MDAPHPDYQLAESVIDRSLDRLFEGLDEITRKHPDLTDEGMIDYLERSGHTDLAEYYQNWIADGLEGAQPEPIPVSSSSAGSEGVNTSASA